MGAFAPLPMLPGMLPQNTPTPQGGLLPFKPNPVASTVQGINTFVNNYLQTQDLLQQNAHRRFMDAIQAKMIGLPVDDDQVMKWAKQAKIPLRTEPYTPEEKQFQQQQQQYNQAWTAMQQGGGISPDQAQMLGQPAPQPPQQQATPQGIFARMAQMFKSPQVSTDSPAGDWLKRLSAAVAVGGGLPGQVAQQGERSNIEQSLFEKGARLQNLTMDQQRQVINMTRSAWSGDPSALDNLARSGMMKQLPGDEMSDLMRMAMPGLPEDQVRQRAGDMMMWLQGGGPQMRMYMMKFAQDLMPRFMNSSNPMMAAWNYASDPVHATEMPALTGDEGEKFGNVWAKVHDASPDAPLPLIDHKAWALFTGNKGLEDASTKALNQWPTSGQKQTTQFAQEWGGPGAAFGGRGVRGEEAAAAASNADSTAKRVVIERGQYELAKAKAVFDSAGDEGKRLWEIANDPKQSIAARNNALDAMANSIGKQAQIKVKLGDKDFTLADPLKTIDDMRSGLTSPLWWLSRTTPLGLATGPISGAPSILQGMPAAPQLGTLPPGTRRALEQMNQAISGLSPEEKSEIIKRSTPPRGDPSGLLQFLGQMPIGAEMPPPQSR